ncbi:MAG: DEAD/DEAH box helicase [Nanoarchaeota archaeon]
MIKNFTPRLYQQTILGTCVRANTLVVLPTGMGKTNVFLMLSAYRLSQYPNSKILFIGPTRPLIDQYKAVFESNFEIPQEKLVTLTGMVSPEKRAELWKQGQIFFSTPQGLENDILSKRINLEEVSLLGIDEAHRAVGDYAYVFIAKQFNKLSRFPRILALTASPGNDVETIKEVCKNLFIDEIEVRTEDDNDVRPYIQDVDVETIKVDLPESFTKIKHCFETLIKSRLADAKNLGVMPTFRILGKKDLLSLQATLHAKLAQGEKDFSVMKTISILAEVMKAQHALELLESAGIASLESYLKKLESQAQSTKVKAVKNLVADANFRSARYLTTQLFEKKIEHPKVQKIIDLVKSEIVKKNDTKLILFTQFRDTAVMLRDLLRESGIKTELFVGQMKKGETGMSQKEQKEMLESFGQGDFSVLVSTSIGEEGLDVPSVDLVVFYEPVPSAIRTIQRRGRTGRLERGKVVVLMAKGTRDEAYKWSAHHKEKLMHRTISSLKATVGELKRTPKLTDFTEQHPTIKILVDFREKGSGVMKQLLEQGVDVQLKQLSVGDYHCSQRAVIELKTVEDFVDSLIDGRLLTQLRELKNMEKPVVLIVGESDIYSARKVHPNAINGMLATIAVSYGIPLVRVRNDKEAAGFLLAVARREQESSGSDFSPHSEKKMLSLKDLQEYIVSSLPGIGITLAKPLLKEFGSVKNVINASEEDLKKVDLVGEKKSKEIRRILDSEYKEY